MRALKRPREEQIHRGSMQISRAIELMTAEISLGQEGRTTGALTAKKA